MLLHSLGPDLKRPTMIWLNQNSLDPVDLSDSSALQYAGHVSDGPVGKFQDHGEFWKQLNVGFTHCHRPTMTGDGFNRFQSHFMIFYGHIEDELLLGWPPYLAIMLPFTTWKRWFIVDGKLRKRAKTTLPWPFLPFHLHPGHHRRGVEGAEWWNRISPPVGFHPASQPRVTEDQPLMWSNCCLVEPHMNKATGFFDLKRDSNMNHLGLWELFLRPNRACDWICCSSHSIDMPNPCPLSSSHVHLRHLRCWNSFWIQLNFGNGFKHQTAAKKNRWVRSNGGWLIFEGEKEKNAGWPYSSPIKNTHVMGIAHFQHPYFSDMSLQCQEHLPKKKWPISHLAKPEKRSGDWKRGFYFAYTLHIF